MIVGLARRRKIIFEFFFLSPVFANQVGEESRRQGAEYQGHSSLDAKGAGPLQSTSGQGSHDRSSHPLGRVACRLGLVHAIVGGAGSRQGPPGYIRGNKAGDHQARRDPRTVEFRRKTPIVSVQPVLCGGIAASQRRCNPTGKTRYGYHDATPGLLHAPDKQAGQQDRGRQVCGHQASDHLGIGIRRRGALAYPQGKNGRVQAAEDLPGPLHQGLRVLGGGIRRKDPGAGTESACKFVQELFPAGGKHHPTPRLGEGLRRCPADAAACPHDPHSVYCHRSSLDAPPESRYCNPGSGRSQRGGDMEAAIGSHYRLQSLVTGRIFGDEDLPCADPEAPKPGLLRSLFKSRRLEVGSEREGLFRFARWLPIRRTLTGSSAPVTYRSTGLGAALELTRLYITFSGYWPDRGVSMETGTFKECEAYSVCGRLPENLDRVLVVASAGNTARAFLHVCGRHGVPALVVVPEAALENLNLEVPQSSTTRLIAVSGGADYRDAIQLADRIAADKRFIAEGGAGNVARRDGMGTTVLSAAAAIGEIPEYYFQAVGSGTGAIAAWEANLRLIEDGRFGSRKAKLMLAQNKPFVPIFQAWRRRRRSISLPAEWIARRRIRRLIAPVLSNRRPPYAVVGGLYDAMVDTKGRCFAVSNEEAMAAGALFERTEGIDIDPAAAVAVAALLQSVRRNLVKADSLIHLNITGGGMGRLRRERRLSRVRPDLVLDRACPDPIGPAAELFDRARAAGKEIP